MTTLNHRCLPRGTSLLAAALFTSLSLPAQWAALPIAPTDPVYQDAFQVLTVTGGQAHAFSAMARSWRNLGPCYDGGYATPPLQYGDFVTLLRMSDHDWRAYSARLDQYADIHFVELPDALTVVVEDDVILMIGTQQGMPWKEACGYSGQTNTWRSIAITPCSVATSRFVLGLKIDGVAKAWGFGARFGSWVELTQYGGELAADGNVLLLKGSPGANAAAFSGVLGMWTVSPAQSASSVPTLDHNVAYVRAYSAAFANGLNCAYSAYTGVWASSGAANSERLTDNTVLVEMPPGAVNQAYRAFGARPGTWATLSVPVAGPVETTDEDWIVVNSPSTTTLHAFSGLCSAAWQNEPYGGTITINTGPDHLAVGRDSTGIVHTFSAMDAAWAPDLPFAGSVSTFTGHCQAVIENAATRFAYSLRNNAWVAGPAKDPAVVHSVAWGGSAYGERNPSSGELVFWHERRSQWLTTSLTGTGTVNRYAGRNVLLLDATSLVPPGPMQAFSAQRGDLVAAPGFVGTPVGTPKVDENVACVRDGAGLLHAFGSPADTHTWYQWPLDTEYQVFTTAAMPPVPMRTMVRGNPGDLGFDLLSLGANFGGVPFPGIGTLYLDLAFGLVVLGPGVVGANGLLLAPIELSILAAPGSAGLWQQGLTFGTSGAALLGPVPESARFF
ncbi:MAG: hypothetical protein WAT39_04465 [Planctomycetota bacterium]